MIDAAVHELIGNQPINVVDIGARAIQGHQPCYHELVKAGLADLTAFDADADACRDLETIYPNARVVAAAVGDGENHRLHCTAMPSKSSLYPPNPGVFDLYQTFGVGMEVVARKTVKTVRLDEVMAGILPDLVTMDIQGGEAMAIAGGNVSFAGALMVETEVEFVEQYKGQPLFGDIDCALRRLGLVFHRFTGYATRTMRPVSIGDDPTRGVNQWLWADAVYYADPQIWEQLPPHRLRVLAALMHHVHNSWDIAFAALAAADRQDGGTTAPYYMSALHDEPDDVAQSNILDAAVA